MAAGEHGAAEPLTILFSDILEREKYLSRDLMKIDVCLALLGGRPPGDVVTISGGFYRYRLEGLEGDTGAQVRVQLTPLEVPSSRDTPDRVPLEFRVPVPGLYGYGLRFLAITAKHLLLQTYSSTITGATATVLYNIASGVGRSVDDIPEMTEYITSPRGDFFLCREHVTKPCAGWLWWAETGHRQLLELTTFKERPEKIVIHPRPSHSHLLYYITCCDDSGQGFLTRYNTSHLSHVLVDTISLSTDILAFTGDHSSLLAIQKYPVNFVSISPDTLELQRSICYHSYSPMTGLPLSFPQIVDSFVQAEITQGLHVSLVVSTRSPMVGTEVSAATCAVLIPVFERASNRVAIIHLSFAENGLAPEVSRVDLYSLEGKNLLTFADELPAKKRDHNHNIRGIRFKDATRTMKKLSGGLKACIRGVHERDEADAKDAEEEEIVNEMLKGDTQSLCDKDFLPERFRRAGLLTNGMSRSCTL